MLFNSVHIESMAHFLPEKIVSSIEIENRLSPLYKKLKLPEGRLELMTGIKERRMWDVGRRPSDLSTSAAQIALQKSDFNKTNIDLLIHSSVCRDFLEPATAAIVHGNLNLNDDCMIMDVSNACLGVLSSILVAGNMIESGAIQTAMIVSGENAAPLLEKTIDFLLKDPSINRKTIKKYFANLTIGSAAVCYILTKNSLLNKNAPQILGGASMTNSKANQLCQGDGGIDSLMMQTDSEQLLYAGIDLASRTWEKTKSILNWSNQSADNIITHQIGRAHEDLLFKSLELDQKKSFSNYQTLGNTGSAALPSALSQLNETNSIQSGNLVALLGIGSGLSSTMLGVKW